MKLILWRSAAARIISFVDSQDNKLGSITDIKLGQIVKKLRKCIRDAPEERLRSTEYQTL